MLDAFVEYSPDAAIVVDAEGRITLSNELANAMFGYETLVGASLESLVPERYRETHERMRSSSSCAACSPSLVSRVMASGRRVMGLTRGGAEFPVDVTISPRQVDLQTVYLAVVRDTTDRFIMERNLRSVLETSLDGFLLVDGDRSILLVNRMAERMFGYGAEELVGTNLGALFQSFLQAPFASAGTDTADGELLVGRHKAGSVVRVQVFSSPVSLDGLPDTTAVVMRSTTAQMLREIELTNQKDSAVAEAAAKSALLANMSREMERPMQQVTSQVDSMRCLAANSAELRACLGRLCHSASSLKLVVDDAVGISRMEAAAARRPRSLPL